MRRASNVSHESGSFWINPQIAASLSLGRVWRGRAIGIVVETKGPLLVVFVIAPLCFTNPLAKVCKSGVLDVTLSDHQFTYFTRGRLHSPSLKPVIRNFRSLKNYCKESFCNSLREVDWNPVLLETNVEIALGCFSELLLGVIDKIAPYYEVKVKHDPAPWMCREILVGIRKCDLLIII